MSTTDFEDFYEVPGLNFDILRLQSELKKILENKKFNSPGVTHFGAIPLNKIPSFRENSPTHLKQIFRIPWSQKKGWLDVNPVKCGP